MAPLYDVMNGEIDEGVTKNLAMRIAGRQRGRHIHARHWDRFAEENGLSATQVRRRVAELAKATLEAVPIVAEDMGKSRMPSPLTMRTKPLKAGPTTRSMSSGTTLPADHPAGEWQTASML
jgi:serine/threonine-protein kinase HipA